MTEWQGFDQRKVCPRCGGYETHLSKDQGASTTAKSSLWLLVSAILVFLILLALLMIITLTKGTEPEPSQLLSLIFTIFVGLVYLISDRGMWRMIHKYVQVKLHGQNASAQEQEMASGYLSSTSTVYHLRCSQCGHQWQKSADEWKKEGQKEIDQSRNFSSSSPDYIEEIASDPVKIEWTPPNPTKGIFLAAAAAGLFILTSISVLGVLWSLTHPDHHSAFLVSSIAVGVMLLILTVLMVVLKRKVIKIIPIVLIILVTIGIQLFLK